MNGKLKLIVPIVALLLVAGGVYKFVLAKPKDAKAEEKPHVEGSVYVLGKEAMRVRCVDSGSGRAWGFVRGLLLGAFLWIRENSRTKLADLDIDADKVIEVGYVKEI